MAHRMMTSLRLLGQRILARSVRLVVGRHTYALVTRTRHGLLAVEPEDQGVGLQLRRHGQYQPDEVDRVAGLVSADDRVLVVGAHVGALVVPLARKCRSVVAVEANPDSAALLRLNLGLNDITNCRILEVAADERCGELRFVKSRTNSGGSKREPLVADPRYVHDRPSRIVVPARRLDDLLVADSVDIVLMDIEGSEIFALRGMQRLLGSVRALVIEFLPHHLIQVAGVTPAEWLEAIPSHLNRMHRPSTGKTYERSDVLEILEAMVREDRGEDGLIFMRGDTEHDAGAGSGVHGCAPCPGNGRAGTPNLRVLGS